eukprot:1875216-Pyramimonas_sp.AAC.1
MPMLANQTTSLLGAGDGQEGLFNYVGILPPTFSPPRRFRAISGLGALADLSGSRDRQRNRVEGTSRDCLRCGTVV